MLRILSRFLATFILIVYSISLLYIYPSHTLPFAWLCHCLLSSSQAQYMTLYHCPLAISLLFIFCMICITSISHYGNIVTVTFHSSVYTFLVGVCSHRTLYSLDVTGNIRISRVHTVRPTQNGPAACSCSELSVESRHIASKGAGRSSIGTTTIDHNNRE